MGASLLSKLLPALEKISWPSKPSTTPLGSQTYEMAMDTIDDYNHDPRTLEKALKIIQSGDSLPYAYAGVAYLLIAAAREKDNSYAQEGIAAAMQWLEKAQEIEPDYPDINFIEALVYMYGNEIENAGLVLDYLLEQAPHYYRINISLAKFWQMQGDLVEMQQWYDQATKQANTVPKKLRLNSWIADAYYGIGDLETALNFYKKAVYFNKESGPLWHKISVIFWKQENFNECLKANKLALKYSNNPAAQKLSHALKAKLEPQDKSLLGRVMGKS